jgi:hypothetical protein
MDFDSPFFHIFYGKRKIESENFQKKYVQKYRNFPFSIFRVQQQATVRRFNYTSPFLLKTFLYLLA